MPDVDSTLRLIARWQYIIVTDLASAFYQIPLSKESSKYCGVVTPFRGVRVYCRSAMGMPGSETALEELMCRILGDLLQDGIVAKLADDLYCGGNTPQELLENWHRILKAFNVCDMKLSPSKTIIAPKTTTILGWIWSNGSINASPHRIATLSTCAPPSTVRGLRSFIGAYKVLARVIPQCSSLITPLDDIIAGCQSQDKIIWSDDTHAKFTSAQHALSSNKCITLPRPSDVLWIVTDGAVKNRGIGATMYAVRDGKPHLAGFFSAKLRPHQVTWIPCEVEALGIATAIKHFSPYIIQSQHRVCALTDSKPCVQAYEKLCRGEFSSSPRVSTFLATVSHYQATLRHLPGCANIPSDFASRNAPDCENPRCQICSFIINTEDSVIRQVSMQSILSGDTRLPFTSRSAWGDIQLECPDLRRTHAHLVQGTRPSRKANKVKDIKRYLQVATIAKDGLLVVKHTDVLAPTRERVIVPRQVLDGLLTALHIKLEHPSSHQLKSVFRRYLYALDCDKSIERMTNSCHQCTALQKTPHTVIPQTTCDPPEAVGISFAADVLKRERQKILVVRETVTSYTSAYLLKDERHETLREGLINLCVPLRPLDGPIAVIRTDPAPGFQALSQDDFLQQQRLCIEIGRIKNINKNPVAEKSIQEVEHELLLTDPSGDPVSPLQLALAIARLNSRVRGRGLSSREMWTQRDQYTNEQIPVVDLDLIIQQNSQHAQNHRPSERAKAPLGKTNVIVPIAIGDLVYLHADRHKNRVCDRYLVVSVDGNWCNIRKFVGSQLRRTSYRVRLSECFQVESSVQHELPKHYSQINEDTNSDIEFEDPKPITQPPVPPPIPHEIAKLDDPNIATPPADEYETEPLPSTLPHGTINTQTAEIPDQQATVLTLPTNSPHESQSITRPKRTRKPPKKFGDYVLY